MREPQTREGWRRMGQGWAKGGCERRLTWTCPWRSGTSARRCRSRCPASGCSWSTGLRGWQGGAPVSTLGRLCAASPRLHPTAAPAQQKREAVPQQRRARVHEAACPRAGRRRPHGSAPVAAGGSSVLPVALTVRAGRERAHALEALQGTLLRGTAGLVEHLDVRRRRDRRARQLLHGGRRHEGRSGAKAHGEHELHHGGSASMSIRARHRQECCHGMAANRILAAAELSARLSAAVAARQAAVRRGCVEMNAQPEANK